jgi:leucyl-tRNA synthetase
MERYDHTKVEKKWQKRWEESGAFTASNDSAKEKEYLLIEFPYPSGDGLHVGHVRSYTAMDVIARKRRAEGKNVLYPIGWDAFGLPAENYAIKTGVHPKITTKQNTDNFRRQIKALGLSFDWSREINTTDPAYYKWTQWIFLEMFKKGLAYKTLTQINWCPKDKVVLANEEVVDGACERCGTPVEKREKEQWMLAITKYAQRLYDDLDTVDYILPAKLGQRNWIAPSQGSEIDFPLSAGEEKIKVFTTRADTMFGATFLVLAPEHPLLKQGSAWETVTNKDEVAAYIQAAKAKSEIERTADGKEKTGVELKGVKAINPASKEEIPLFVADYVLGNYGTGAIMAVPAHDDRDMAFAKKYTLPITDVLSAKYILDGESKERDGVETLNRKVVDPIIHDKEGNFYLVKEGPQHIHFAGGGIDGDESDTDALKREIIEETGFTDFTIGRKIVPAITVWGYRHTKDKNQRSVGYAYEVTLNSDTRIHSEVEDGHHELVKVSKDEVLKTITWGHHRFLFEQFLNEQPFVDEGVLVNSGEFDGLTSAEAKQKITEAVGGKVVTTFKLRDWVFGRQRYWGEPIPMIHCEKDGWVGVPEDQLPVLLPETDKFLPGKEGESPLASMDEWVNTTCPTCGGPGKRETDVMPQWAGSSWYYLRYIDPKNDTNFASKENLNYWTPVNWYNGGMEHTTLHLLYSRFWHKFLFDQGLVPSNEPYMKRTSHGIILAEDGTKMSKSKGNTVSPDTIVEQFGADSLRLYEMFIGPFDQMVPWSSQSIIGVRRFLERIWKLGENLSDSAIDIKTEALMHQTIQKVSADIDALKMNTAVSTLMIYTNHLAELETVPKIAYEVLVKLLSAFAPHIAAELYEQAGFEADGLMQWPVADASKLVQQTVTVAVQINGKTRATLELAANAGQDEALSAARAHGDIAPKLAAGKEARAIYVPGKIINFVLI